MSSRPEPSRRRRTTRVRRTPVAARPSRGGLTTRAAVLGLVVCALVVSAALPLREYLSQHGRISSAVAGQRAQQARVAVLEQQLARWQDPAYVRSQARSRLHYVLPGETAYVLLSPGGTALPTGPAALPSATASGPQSPWYSQVWGSVVAADHPARLR